MPYSCSLCTVADAHTEQLNNNPGLNGHDWEDCKYEGNMACMGDKPRELTGYQGEGFENYVGTLGYPSGSGGSMSPLQALDEWKKSPEHNNAILNLDIWSPMEWKAMGASVDRGFAVLWFGKEVDNKCGDQIGKPIPV